MSRSTLILLAITGVVGRLSADEPAPNVSTKVLVELAQGGAAAVQRTLRQAEALRAERHDVTLFLDAEAVSVAARNSTTDEVESEIAQSFARLTEAGVVVLICPHCAQEQGLDEGALRKPARFTSRDELEAARREADRIYEYRESNETPAPDRTTRTARAPRSGTAA